MRFCLITTPENLLAYRTTEVYNVADLVACRHENGEILDDYDPLIDLITSQADPTSWDAVGGPGAITGDTFGSAKVLIVTQNWQVHHQIKDLLAQIRAIGAKSPGDGKVPTRSRPTPQAQGNIDLWDFRETRRRPRNPKSRATNRRGRKSDCCVRDGVMGR